MGRGGWKGGTAPVPPQMSTPPLSPPVRGIGVRPPLTDHYMCLCFRIVLFLTARSYRVPTTIAKRMQSVMSFVSNGPCDQDYALHQYSTTTYACFRVVPSPRPVRSRKYHESQTINIFMIHFQPARAIGNIPSRIDHSVRVPSVCPSAVTICERVCGKENNLTIP